MSCGQGWMYLTHCSAVGCWWERRGRKDPPSTVVQSALCCARRAMTLQYRALPHGSYASLRIVFTGLVCLFPIFWVTNIKYQAIWYWSPTGTAWEMVMLLSLKKTVKAESVLLTSEEIWLIQIWWLFSGDDPLLQP